MAALAAEALRTAERLLAAEGLRAALGLAGRAVLTGRLRAEGLLSAVAADEGVLAAEALAAGGLVPAGGGLGEARRRGLRALARQVGLRSAVPGDRRLGRGGVRGGGLRRDVRGGRTGGGAARAGAQGEAGRRQGGEVATGTVVPGAVPVVVGLAGEAGSVTGRQGRRQGGRHIDGRDLRDTALCDEAVVDGRAGGEGRRGVADSVVGAGRGHGAYGKPTTSLLRRLGGGAVRVFTQASLEQRFRK